MVNSEEYLSLLKESVEGWNHWRQENPSLQPDLSGARLNGASLGGANLSGANLRDAVLSFADLRHANLAQADLCNAKLSGAQLSGASLRDAVLSGAQLSGTILSQADLYNADLSQADLSNADLSNADLRGTDLSHTDLHDAVLSDVNLSFVSLSSAHLPGATLSNAILSFVDLSHADLRNVRLTGAKLSGAKLMQADLSGAALRGTDLSFANLSGAMLAGAILSQAHLSGVDLRQANLSRAELREVNLSGADLRQADLQDADLEGADLEDANLYQANLNNANLAGVDLTVAIFADPLTGEETAVPEIAAADLPKSMLVPVAMPDEAIAPGGWLGRLMAGLMPQETLVKLLSHGKVTFGHPKRLAKGAASTIVVNLELLEAYPAVDEPFLEAPSVEPTAEMSSLTLGASAVISLSSPSIRFSEAVTQTFVNRQHAIAFTAIPHKDCQPGKQPVTLCLRDCQTDREYESVSFTLVVDDDAFDRIPKPTLTRASGLAAGVGAVALFALAYFQLVGAVLAIPTGCAAIAFAAYCGFRLSVLYGQRVNLPKHAV
jgi:uncharacterized protein YjbI with pentapeptide repeats